MLQQNRVTPYGDIIISPLRGAWMGNRGCIHRDLRIVRPWANKRWITCALEFKGWTAPKWAPGRWTALFFYDEALALAAGHRPCALCRRADYDRFRAACRVLGADAIDAELHAQRLQGRRKRVHLMPWSGLHPGVYVELDGIPHLVRQETVQAWSPIDGYTQTRIRPLRGQATVLTPPLSVLAIANGYTPQIDSR